MRLATGVISSMHNVLAFLILIYELGFVTVPNECW